MAHEVTENARGGRPPAAATNRPTGAGTISRRKALGAVVIVGLSSTACFKSKTPELNAQDILTRSSDALAKAKSAHFVINSTNGMMSIGTGLVAKTIEGDVVQPDRLKGQATSTFGRITVQIGFVEIGNKQYITNPITRKWQEVPGSQPAPNLLDPNKGAPAALKQATDLKKLANENIAGTDCYHVTGKTSASLVAGLVGLPGTSATLASDIWVGVSDLLPRRIALDGAVTKNEPPNIKRTLDLSNYNEQVTIEPPA